MSRSSGFQYLHLQSHHPRSSVGRRHLDDYYSYVDETLKQHPWFSSSMLIVLALLLAVIIGYGLYQVYFQAKDCEKSSIAEPIVCGKNDDDDAIASCTDDAAPKKSIEMNFSTNNNQLENDYVHMNTVSSAAPYTNGVSA